MQRYEHKQLAVIGGTSGMGLGTQDSSERKALASSSPAAPQHTWLKLAASSAMT
jgi:hypothetical protein